MTDKNKTLIAALLDRSGSMMTSKAATEEGFNALIRDQAKVEGQALVTLAQFDTQTGRPAHRSGWLNSTSWGEPQTFDGYKPEFVYRMRDITNVPTLNLQPRGGTPLLDCLAEFIKEIGTDLAKMREQDRPGLVILVVMTDGEENSSVKWTKEQVKALIEQQEGAWKWKFLFLGANIDAVETGASLGVLRGSSLTFRDDDAVAVAAAYGSTSNMVSGMRGMAAAGAAPEAVLASAVYSDDDREAAMGKKPVTSGSK